MLCLKIRLNSIADIFKWEIRSSFWKSTVFYAGFKVLAMSILQEIGFFHAYFWIYNMVAIATNRYRTKEVIMTRKKLLSI